jgi:hypothetical protein
VIPARCLAHDPPFAIKPQGNAGRCKNSNAKAVHDAGWNSSAPRPQWWAFDD